MLAAATRSASTLGRIAAAARRAAPHPALVQAYASFQAYADDAGARPSFAKDGGGGRLLLGWGFATVGVVVGVGAVSASAAECAGGSSSAPAGLGHSASWNASKATVSKLFEKYRLQSTGHPTPRFMDVPIERCKTQKHVVDLCRKEAGPNTSPLHSLT